MGQLVRYLAIITLGLATLGCKSTGIQISHNANTNAQDLINNAAFENTANIVIESKEDIFSLTPEMKEVVKTHFSSERNKQQKAMKLVRHIFNQNNIGLAYQSNANLTASQTYESKTANCMSLTIMAYALAKEAGLDAKFQDVEIPEYWVRNGQYNMLTGHVNLMIAGVKSPNVSVVWGATNIEIDFDPFIRKKNFPKTKVDLDTVVAMFYNNKGAQALVDEDYDRAYRYFTAAIESAPYYAASWGNLAVLYRFTDQLELAEETYRYAIKLDPKSLNTLTNLSMLLEKQGKFDESRRIDSAILKQRIKNPYYHALLADEAFYAGNPEGAVRHYKRAIKLNDKIHEFYYGLAKVFATMGRVDSAKLAMKKAINVNKTPDIEQTYLAKLSLLNQ